MLWQLAAGSEIDHEHRYYSFPRPEFLPAPIFAPTPKAARRVVEFYTAQINNDDTRKAYLNAARRFALWCEGRGLQNLRGTR